MNQKIRCTGVAEHFNYPWKMGLEKGQFEKAGIDLQWEDCPGGTGAMCESLRNNEIDLAVILTEGIIADILKGNPSRIVSTYVDSPLIWGLHTSARNIIEKPEELQNLPFAISRFNSGSHLMAYVHAQNRNWSIEDDQFNVVGSLQGAISSLAKNPEQLFLWEKFTTKPFVDQGHLKLIDECPTPWPSFVVVVREAFLKENSQLVSKVLSIVNENALSLKQSAESPILIAEKYQLKFEDTVEWFNTLDWSVNQSLKPEVIKNVHDRLHELKIISKSYSQVELEQLILHDLSFEPIH